MTAPTTTGRASLPRRLMILVFVFMLVGGALRSVEAGCQNSLKLSLHNVFLCGVISYAVALAGVGLVFAVTSARSTRRHWPSRADLRAMPPWAPFGGLTGGAAIFAMITVASSVGVSTFNALIIAGQMLLATAMDHFGVMGFPRRRLGPRRLAGCVLLVAGSYLMAKY
ncbi:DMT family transporter [Nocardia blacklockiae]|uniref:DMT family transporter n=1 Tax=Nocardia blacklockiae TaxID=480036 RepID=UPI0018963508|nr:DMT family transporter [Nocardia blacklockiae]MBF6172506.1 DMT family transporter [Nocardia blacklockiae]